MEPWEETQERNRRRQNWHEFWQAVGAEYRGCEFDSYRPTNDAAAKVKSRLTEFAKAADIRRPLLLLGGCGTGKDHLLVACAKHFIRAGKTITWANASELFRRSRDAMNDHERESALIFEYTKRGQVLYLSDLMTERDALTDHQSQLLYDIIDRRARDGRGVWVSANATSREELESHIGVATTERLIDGALVIKCTWPSYRKPAEVLA